MCKFLTGYKSQAKTILDMTLKKLYYKSREAISLKGFYRNISGFVYGMFRICLKIQATFAHKGDLSVFQKAVIFKMHICEMTLLPQKDGDKFNVKMYFLL